MSLASLTRQKRVLELGAYCGRSTVAMAQHAESVTSVDTFCGDAFTGECGEGWTLPEFQDNLKRYGVVDRVDVRVGRIEDIGPTLEPIYDLVFVDSAHDEKSVARDLQVALHCLRPEGGILAMHDWLEPGVQQAIGGLGWSANDGKGVTVDGLHWRHIGQRPVVRQQSVFMALPHTGTVSAEAIAGLCWASKRGHLVLSPGKISLLATNFNQLWCEALNYQTGPALTHFAMHHSDISAPEWWVDTLAEELERVGADVLSVVVPLKDERGLTTTAVGSGDNSIRRLTLREVHELPETFCIDDIPGKEENRRLLINTGLWICKFTDPWIRPPIFPGFKLKDQVRLNETNGKYEALCLSEDWGISEWFHSQGLKVFATRKVAVTHYGVTGYHSDRPYGRWQTDLGDNRKDEIVADNVKIVTMPEARYYEERGRALAAQESLLDNYRILMSLIAKIQSGDINPQSIKLDFDNNTWAIEAPAFEPQAAEPANILPLPAEPTPTIKESAG